MKTLIINLTIILGLSFFVSGCYTIVWDPTEEFPDEESYSGSDEFYGSDYYGGYGGYYESPWWITVPVPVYIITPEGVVEKKTTKERNNGRSTDSQEIRNSSGERGFNDRDNGINTTNPTTTRGSGNSDVNKTPPPTRDTSYERTNSSNNSGSSGSSSNNSRSSDNGSRNNSGSRNSGNSRR